MSSRKGRTPPDRIPRNYQTILETIGSATLGVHLTAQDVYELARQRLPSIGFATVHRGLVRLSELGLVVRVEIPGAAAAVYEPVAPPHAHFRCTACGGIDDVAFSLPVELVSSLAREHGLQIAAEHTTFAGRCARCAVADEASAPVIC